LISFLIPISPTYLSSAYYPRSPVAPATSATSATPVYRGHIDNPTLTSPAVADVANIQSLPYTPPGAPPALIPGATSLHRPSSQCSSDRPCVGDITYYNIGLGACGITSNRDAQNMVALPYNIISPKSNDPYYNTITITCIATSKSGLLCPSSFHFQLPLRLFRNCQEFCFILVASHPLARLQQVRPLLAIFAG
jgi:hypothetical protein